MALTSSSGKPIRVVLIQPSEPFGPMVHLPISLIDMAAILKNGGVDVEILDARADNLSVSQTIKKLEGKEWTAAGITGLNNAYRFIKDFSFEFKRKFPDSFLIGGGAFITFEFEDILHKTAIDVACIGEGEEIILDLVKRLANKEDCAGIPNLAYLKHGNLVKSELSWIKDFDKLPFPAYELLDMPRYLKPVNVDQPAGVYFPIATGRGCVHHCYFCAKPGKGVRRPSVNKIFEHMELLNSRYGINGFCFYEDSSFYPREFLLEFCKKYLESGKRYTLSLAGCPEQLDDEELITCVSKMECKEINIAVEHWNPEIQKAFYRITQSKHIYSAWDLIKKHNLFSYNFNILWGHPKDTAKSFRESYLKSIENARQYEIAMFSFATLVIYPNSDLHRDALKQGKIIDYEDYMYACGGYGPYVNLTTEDNDNYRSVIVEMRYMQEIHLAIQKLEFLLYNNVNIEISTFEAFRNEIQRLTNNLTGLRQITLLPPEARERYRTTLESLLCAEIYNPHKNHYKEIACFAELLALSARSRVAVFGREFFAGDNIAKLFNSAREAQVTIAGFVDMTTPSSSTFEGLPVVAIRNLSELNANTVLLPGSKEDSELAKSMFAIHSPGINVVTIGKEGFQRKPWLSGGLNGWYNNPAYWKIAIEGNQLVTRYVWSTRVK